MPKPARGGHAVGRAGRDGHRVREQQRVGMQDQAQLVVGPQRIDLGQVGQVEGAPLQAREVRDDAQVVQQRIRIEVRLVKAAAIRRPPPAA